MARPHKQTVDYFPHNSDASSSKTLFILESKFGNDGYAFWFKLLELLASSEGHVSDVRNPIAWEFLLAKTHIEKDTGEKIMELLVDLEAIDRDLWAHRIIWVQNLVDNVADAYRNRTTDIPKKPSFNSRKPEPTGVNGVENEVTNTDNPQTILKETKLNKSKEEKRLDFEEYAEELRAEYSDLDYDNEIKKFHLYWSEGDRKLKRPKLALKNWMDKAKEYKQEKGGRGGEHQGHTGAAKEYTHLPTPGLYPEDDEPPGPAGAD